MSGPACGHLDQFRGPEVNERPGKPLVASRFGTFGIREILPCDPLGARPLIAASFLLDQTPWGWNWSSFWGMIEIFLMKFHFL